MTNPPTAPSARQPLPLGGWLILPAIGLVLSPLLTIGDIGRLREAAAAAISSTSARGTPLVDPDRAKEIMKRVDVASVVLAAKVPFLLIAAYAFFCKRRYTPQAYLTAMIAVVILNLLGTLTLQLPQEDVCSNLSVPLIIAAIWVPYFYLSKRAKATFVT